MGNIGLKLVHSEDNKTMFINCQVLIKTIFSKSRKGTSLRSRLFILTLSKSHMFLVSAQGRELVGSIEKHLFFKIWLIVKCIFHNLLLTTSWSKQSKRRGRTLISTGRRSPCRRGWVDQPTRKSYQCGWEYHHYNAQAWRFEGKKSGFKSGSLFNFSVKRNARKINQDN